MKFTSRSSIELVKAVCSSTGLRLPTDSPGQWVRRRSINTVRALRVAAAYAAGTANGRERSTMIAQQESLGGTG